MTLRYEKADNLLQLALEMQAARYGLSLADIQERFHVGRRTAMRMRDAVLRNFPQAAEVETEGRGKRWRLPAGLLDRLISFSADELADLSAAVETLAAGGQPERAGRLENLQGKLRALLPPDAARRAEPDIEALLEAEGLAMRPGPKPKTAAGVADILRDAVKACRKVKLHYRNRRDRRVNERLVHPYGFLFGHRNYLVAFHEHPKADKVTLFSLPNIERAEAAAEFFVREPNFSLKDFAARSFGVYQEEPFDVVWRFQPDAATTAAEFEFHPTQRLEHGQDGSLTVRFRAGSDLEMAWHLFVWGDKVEVLEPKRLADMIAKHRPNWPALP